MNSMAKKLLLENVRAGDAVGDYDPDPPLEGAIRPTDQVIVFLDDCEYERTDSKTGEKTVRTRKSGEIVWHDRGEDAPVLKNLGAKPYRSLLIELKDRL